MMFKYLRSIVNLLTSPFYLLEKFLLFLALSINKLRSGLKLISKKINKSSVFELIPITDFIGYKKMVEKNGGVERISLPKIVGLSNGGYICVNMPSDYLYSLDNVIITPKSDFIRNFEGCVSNEKLYRKEYDVQIPLDSDIVEIKDKKIRLFNKRSKVYSKVAFSLLGTHLGHWAHFLAQYYPKLMFFENLNKEESIDIVIPKNIDSHIKFLIENEVNKYSNFQFLEVDDDTAVHCDKLYNVNLGTFVADHGYFPTPFSIIISNSTLRFWKDRAIELTTKSEIHNRKIYLERLGNRSLINSKEIKMFFLNQGFEEVFPHLLTIEEKFKVFSEAKYIVGPGSSGFSNNIYSKKGTKILAFINSWRYLDTFLPAYCDYTEQEFWFISGKDQNIEDMNSSYEIPLQDIKSFLDDSNFLND